MGEKTVFPSDFLLHEHFNKNSVLLRAIMHHIYLKFDMVLQYNPLSAK